MTGQAEWRYALYHKSSILASTVVSAPPGEGTWNGRGDLRGISGAVIRAFLSLGICLRLVVYVVWLPIPVAKVASLACPLLWLLFLLRSQGGGGGLVQRIRILGCTECTISVYPLPPCDPAGRERGDSSAGGESLLDMDGRSQRQRGSVTVLRSWSLWANKGSEVDRIGCDVDQPTGSLAGSL